MFIWYIGLRIRNGTTPTCHRLPEYRHAWGSKMSSIIVHARRLYSILFLRGLINVLHRYSVNFASTSGILAWNILFCLQMLFE
jgi:hypothetical protein